MDKINKFLPLITLVVLVVGFGYLAQPHSSLGGTTNFNDLSVDSITNAGVLTQTGALNIAGALNASSTLFSQGNFQTRASTTVGNAGTAINFITCGTTSKTLPAVGSQATTTVPFSITGISTSSNQVYWFGMATSTPAYTKLTPISYIQSSTPNGIDVVLYNVTSSAIAAASTAVDLTLCVLQVD